MELLVQTIEQYRIRPISGELAFACFTDESESFCEDLEVLIFIDELEPVS